MFRVRFNLCLQQEINSIALLYSRYYSIFYTFFTLHCYQCPTLPELPLFISVKLIYNVSQAVLISIFELKKTMMKIYLHFRQRIKTRQTI